jgi:hypothetical protein
VVRALSVLCFTGCQRTPDAAKESPIVGAWYARVFGAPFTYQMYLFNSDGTMQESNPDAGDRHAFGSRGEISFQIPVDGDRLIGTETGRFYDARGIRP